jgi:hypothetical protein
VRYQAAIILYFGKRTDTLTTGRVVPPRPHTPIIFKPIIAWLAFGPHIRAALRDLFQFGIGCLK